MLVIGLWIHVLTVYVVIARAQESKVIMTTNASFVEAPAIIKNLASLVQVEGLLETILLNQEIKMKIGFAILAMGKVQ